MRKLMILLAALAVATLAWAQTLEYSSGTSGISVSQTNTNLAFTDNRSGGSNAAFQARHVLIRSRSASANTCYFDLGADGVATTADRSLAPGASISRSWDDSTGGVGGGWSRVGMICAAGQTATWDVDAAR